MDLFQWGLAGVDPSEENFFAAYQMLIDSGLAWRLQGRVGRTAMDLIRAGYCTVPSQQVA